MTSNQNPHDETFDFDDVTIPPVDDLDDKANQDVDVTLPGPTTGEFETLPPDRTTPLESAVGTRVRYFKVRSFLLTNIHSSRSCLRLVFQMIKREVL